MPRGYSINSPFGIKNKKQKYSNSTVLEEISRNDDIFQSLCLFPELNGNYQAKNYTNSVASLFNNNNDESVSQFRCFWNWFLTAAPLSLTHTRWPQFKDQVDFEWCTLIKSNHSPCQYDIFFHAHSQQQQQPINNANYISPSLCNNCTKYLWPKLSSSSSSSSSPLSFCLSLCVCATSFITPLCTSKSPTNHKSQL